MTPVPIVNSKSKKMNMIEPIIFIVYVQLQLREIIIWFTLASVQYLRF